MAGNRCGYVVGPARRWASCARSATHTVLLDADRLAARRAGGAGLRRRTRPRRRLGARGARAVPRDRRLGGRAPRRPEARGQHLPVPGPGGPPRRARPGVQNWLNIASNLNNRNSAPQELNPMARSEVEDGICWIWVGTEKKVRRFETLRASRFALPRHPRIRFSISVRSVNDFESGMGHFTVRVVAESVLLSLPGSRKSSRTVSRSIRIALTMSSKPVS